MNKIALASLAISFSVICGAANAADGVVNFTGNITDSTCEVTTASKNLTVNLGNVSRTAFKSTGDVSARTAFTLQLQNCPETVSSANVKFDGLADTLNKQLFSLGNGVGVATGVGIGIRDNTNTQFLAPNTASSPYALLSNQVNNLDFTAAYVSTVNAVTVGTANLVVPFTVVYN